MNSIIFKANRIDNGETVYGWPYPILRGNGFNLVDGYHLPVAVKPDSIKQWTTVYDKHGTMIFDGDRVRISRYDGELQEEDIVQWKDGAWFVDAGVFCGSQNLGSYSSECLEVIYDN